MSQVQNRPVSKGYKKPLTSPHSLSNGKRLQRDSTKPNLRKRQPLVFWGGIWAIVFLISITALANLLSPSSSKDPSWSHTRVQSPINQSGQKHSPFWVLGAIVLSCGASSLLITRRLGPPPTRSVKHPKKRIIHKPAGPVSSPVQRPIPEVVVTSSSPIPAMSVAIVPSEQPHPLDKGEVNLAELLDLRKQSPNLWGYRRQQG